MQPTTYAQLAAKRVAAAKESGCKLEVSEVGGFTIWSRNPRNHRLACLYVGTVGGSDIARVDDLLLHSALNS